MGLNFFNDKFSIKSTFLKVTGRYIHQKRFTFVNIFATFIGCTFFVDKLLMNTTVVFGQKIKAMIFCTKWWLKAAGIAQNCHFLVFLREFRSGKDNFRVLSFFSQRLPVSPSQWVADSPSMGVADSPTRRVGESFSR